MPCSRSRDLEVEDRNGPGIAEIKIIMRRWPTVKWCRVSDPMSGQTTGIVAFIDSERVRGASVGDPSAWLIARSGGMTDLTAAQRRKPLLGSGEALPVQFEAEGLGKTDGLFKYAPVDRIRALATRRTVAEATNALANCVRLPSGAFYDDVAVVIVSR